MNSKDEFLSDFKAMFPRELLPLLMDLTIQTHADNPCGYLQRAKSLWQHSTLMQHLRRTEFERRSYRAYDTRDDVLRHNGHEVVGLQNVIHTAFACTQIQFYDMLENWDLMRTIARHIRQMKLTGSTARFKKLHHLLCRMFLSLQFHRWWVVLAWTVYYKVQGTPWFYELHNSLVVEERHKQRSVRRPDSRELSFLMDNPVWNTVRSTPQMRAGDGDPSCFEEYLVSEEDLQRANET